MVGNGFAVAPRRPVPYLLIFACCQVTTDATLGSRFSVLTIVFGTGGSDICQLINSMQVIPPSDGQQLVWGAGLSTSSGNVANTGGIIGLPSEGLPIAPTDILRFGIGAVGIADTATNCWLKLREILDDPIYPSPQLGRKIRHKPFPQFGEEAP